MPRFRTIRWKLIVSSLLTIGIPLILFGFFLSSQLWNFYLQQAQGELRSKALHVCASVGPLLDPRTPDDPAALARTVERWKNYDTIRVTVADRHGMIRAATTASGVGQQISDANRPGMWQALRGEANSMVWKNPDYGNEDSIYVNMPLRVGEPGKSVEQGGRIVGVVRVAHSLTQVQQNIARIRSVLVAGFTGYGALIIALTFLLASSIVGPVEELNRSARKLAAGDLTHRVAVRGTDEIVTLGDTLNQMTRRLQHLEGMRRQYVSNVSHELRTPLASIRGMAETLIAHGEEDPALGKRYLPRIIAQTERLARLASQLLDLAQIESGNLVASFQPVQLRSVVDEVIQTCGTAAQERGVVVRLEMPEELPEICGDRDRLVQVFLNLLDNALRYTGAGREITISAQAKSAGLTASVRDEGTGIPATHLPHLFERFYRVEESRTGRNGGTGLGLSIVRQIVEAHGGTIGVRSEVGMGTEFILHLPYAGPLPTGNA